MWTAWEQSENLSGGSCVIRLGEEGTERNYKEEGGRESVIFTSPLNVCFDAVFVNTNSVATGSGRFSP